MDRSSEFEDSPLHGASNADRIKDALESIQPLPASERQIGGTHYKDFEIQPGEFIYRNDLNWFEGNAIKYICRHKAKGGKLDIEKAIHYLQLLLEKEYNDE